MKQSCSGASSGQTDMQIDGHTDRQIDKNSKAGTQWVKNSKRDNMSLEVGLEDTSNKKISGVMLNMKGFPICLFSCPFLRIAV